MPKSPPLCASRLDGAGDSAIAAACGDCLARRCARAHSLSTTARARPGGQFSTERLRTEGQELHITTAAGATVRQAPSSVLIALTHSLSESLSSCAAVRAKHTALGGATALRACSGRAPKLPIVPPLVVTQACITLGHSFAVAMPSAVGCRCSRVRRVETQSRTARPARLGSL